jgi:DNA-binding IclR family transcriptional regulator
VSDYRGRIAAAIGVALIAAQHDRASVERVVDLVRAAAEGISSELGYANS